MPLAVHAQVENETTRAQVLALQQDTANIGAAINVPVAGEAPMVDGVSNGASSYGWQVWL